MGADLIGYVVKGPVKMQARRIKAAVRACLRQRKTLMGDAGKGATRSERMDAAQSATGEYFDPQDIPVSPAKDIRAFVDWWVTLDSRDTCSRTDPDDPRQKLVYAGEMSWGDEPEGTGYQMLKRAFAWGFAETLGVR